MAKRRHPEPRPPLPRRQPRREASPKKAKAGAGKRRTTRRHPLYGEIPLVEVAWTDELGGRHTYLDYDLGYRPTLPPGAIRADLRWQVRCGLEVPHYFYVDRTTECVQCGRDFVFSAGEQKYWYERLGFPARSVAIRCVRCRRQARTLKALQAQLSRAKALLREDPGRVSAWLELGQAIVQLHRRTGDGNLDEAIHAAREAARLSPTPLPECIFWEAAAHEQAGRSDRARELYGSFLVKASRRRRQKRLVSEAEARRTALGESNGES